MGIKLNSTLIGLVLSAQYVMKISQDSNTETLIVFTIVIQICLLVSWFVYEMVVGRKIILLVHPEYPV